LAEREVKRGDEKALKQEPQAKEALERALATGLQEPLASEAKRLLAESKAKESKAK